MGAADREILLKEQQLAVQVNLGGFVFTLCTLQEVMNPRNFSHVTFLCLVFVSTYLNVLASENTENQDGERLKRSYGKRITPHLVAELGKRPKELYSFGIGKRSISDQELAEMMLEEQEKAAATSHHHEDTNLHAEDKRDPYAFGLGKRGQEYSFGLGRKRDPYAFGLGKRADPYAFGMGKKNDDPYAFGLGKRDPYAFGLGKRDPYAFGLGKRDPYAFGLGKRDPYAFGLGKRDPYAFGLGKRDPYAFGLGKRSAD